MREKVALVAVAFLLIGAARAGEALSVPAFTAYIEPDPNGLRVSKQKGVSGWTDAKHKVVWFGNLNANGRLDVSLLLRLPEGNSAKLRLRVAEKELTAEIAGKGAELVSADFGSVEIEAEGYHSFTLEGVSKTGKTFGDLDALRLSGPAAAGAHFNLQPRRNAASVHLGFPAPKGTQVEWFYSELTARAEPLWSYYMACGFHRGYFGIQVNSPTERRIIFSVWDSGNEAIDRKKVAADDRVQLVAKGEGVHAGDFGNEGTGGHSHLVYKWEKDKTYRFLLAAKPDGKSTLYSGYFYFPEREQWGLIASFRAPKDGGYLRGLYSFNENFVGSNGHLRRLAEFGNQWIKGADGKWTELVDAKFSHDPTGKDDRKDYAAGVVDGKFYLSNGGFVAEPVKYGQAFKRPAGGKAPEIELPEAGRK